ncbi:MAG: hypothetical protein WA974_19480 [Thermodesulfobacteriota bacterium]
MRIRWGIILIGILALFSWGCTTFKTIDLGYSPAKVLTPLPGSLKIAVIPFEDLTLNGQENPNWVGQASLYGIKLYTPNSISYLVTRGAKNEMAAYGYQLSTDEIYSIQINRHDIRTLLKKLHYIQVDFLVGGTISHFFVQQIGRYIAEVEIEAYLIRPPDGEIVWSKKIGHREIRVPFTPEDFSPESEHVLNNLLQKTLTELFRNSDFRLHALRDQKK